MNNELVSAIILTHNRLDLLKRAVDSVLSQTYPNIEVIVVDNGSTDGTKEYLSKLEGIRYVSFSPTIGNGCNQARNYAISISHGEWCAFLDDDDCWMPAKIERQLEVAREQKCGFLFCGIRRETIDESGNVIYSDEPASIDLQGDISRKSLYQQIAYTSTLMVSKKLLLDVGCFDVKQQFWQETELIMRLSQISPLFAAEEPLTLYRSDTIDPTRQTNRIKGWDKSVKHCYRKHAKLVSKLTLYERNLMYRRLLLSALNRSRGLPLLNKMFLFQLRVVKTVRRILAPLGIKA